MRPATGRDTCVWVQNSHACTLHSQLVPSKSLRVHKEKKIRKPRQEAVILLLLSGDTWKRVEHLFFLREAMTMLVRVCRNGFFSATLSPANLNPHPPPPRPSPTPASLYRPHNFTIPRRTPGLRLALSRCSRHGQRCFVSACTGRGRSGRTSGCRSLSPSTSQLTS